MDGEVKGRGRICLRGKVKGRRAVPRGAEWIPRYLENLGGTQGADLQHFTL